MKEAESRSALSKWLDAHRIVNASGTMTSLGASSVSEEVAAAVQASLPYFLDMHRLQAFAGARIARSTGAEAGCVTASAAAGIAVSVAAHVAGSDRSLIEALPDSSRAKRRRVVLQKGHEVDFGAAVSQMIRLGGGVVEEIGTVSSCQPHHLEGALDEEIACALFVVSHHTVQSGMLAFPTFVRICREKNVPVIVDAASEYDLRIFIDQGADLVVYSGHKFLGGPTAGIIAGRKELVRACYINQSVGIGRAMKVGKESIVGTIAALDRRQSLDHHAVHEEEYARIAALRDGIGNLRGIRLDEVPDPTGNPITRLRVSPAGGPKAAARLVRMLAEGTAPIAVRGHHVGLGFFELDPCNLLPGDVELIVRRFREVLEKGAPARPSAVDSGEEDRGRPTESASRPNGGRPATDLGPRFSRYDQDGLPGIDRDLVPWQYETEIPSREEAALIEWPDRYLEE